MPRPRLTDFFRIAQRPSPIQEYRRLENEQYLREDAEMDAEMESNQKIVLQKPKLLFLDDRSKRIHAALDQFRGFEVVIVPNVKECLRALSRADFAVVHLDHDLRGVDFEDPDSPECGMEVVRYLEKTGWPEGKAKPRFIVHSKNLFAAHMMVRNLRQLGLDAHYQPFVYEEIQHMKYDERGFPIK